MEATEPPYSSYAAIAATFLGGLALAAAHDKVTSFLREPFVEGEAYDGDDEAPAGEGLQRAIGELVTCTRCVGAWVAAGLGTAQVVTPRFGRLLTWSLAAGAANDFLQTAFVALNRKSEEASDRV